MPIWARPTATTTTSRPCSATTSCQQGTKTSCCLLPAAWTCMAGLARPRCLQGFPDRQGALIENCLLQEAPVQAPSWQPGVQGERTLKVTASPAPLLRGSSHAAYTSYSVPLHQRATLFYFPRVGLLPWVGARSRVAVVMLPSCWGRLTDCMWAAPASLRAAHAWSRQHDMPACTRVSQTARLLAHAMVHMGRTAGESALLHAALRGADCRRAWHDQLRGRPHGLDG